MSSHIYLFDPCKIGMTSQISNFHTSTKLNILNISLEISLRWMPEDPKDDVNIGSSNGLVMSGTKPLLELMLANFHNIIWHH